MSIEAMRIETMPMEARAFANRRQSPLPIVAILAVLSNLTAIASVTAATLDRIRESGHIKLGYLSDARPFSYETERGPDGFSIDLCKRVVAEVKRELAIDSLTVDWVPLSLEGRLRQVQQGTVDLLCSPTGVTWERRKDVSFSIPIFSGGARAVLRADASSSLRNSLSDVRNFHVVWRSSPAAKTLSSTTVAVVAGTTTESWLARRLASLELDAKTIVVKDYKEGLQLLRERKADIFFADRVLVLKAMAEKSGQINPLQREFSVLERLLTHEPFSLALAHGDEEFRLVVDRSLGQFYATKEFSELHGKWLGEFREDARNYYLWNTLEQ